MRDVVFMLLVPLLFIILFAILLVISIMVGEYEEAYICAGEIFIAVVLVYIVYNEFYRKMRKYERA